MSRVCYAHIAADGTVSYAGHCPEEARATIEQIGETIVTEQHYAILEARNVSGLRYRMTDGDLHVLAAEPVRADTLAMLARRKRDELLAGTDKMLMEDYPLDPGSKPALLAYRRALRALPRQPGFPRTIVWPTPVA